MSYKDGPEEYTRKFVAPKVEFSSIHNNRKSVGFNIILKQTYFCFYWFSDFGWFMVFNATFNNISVILWRTVLLVEESGVPGENHWPVASNWQTLSHNVVSSTPRLSGIRTHNISGDKHWLHTGSWKSNNHTIMTTTVPFWFWKTGIFYFSLLHLHLLMLKSTKLFTSFSIAVTFI